MFPTGGAGVGLAILRFVVGTLVLVEGAAHWTPAASSWVFAVLVLIAACLYQGFMTPYCAAISCVVESILFALTGASNRFQLGMSLLTSVSVALLGPGAYSIDALIFGRKLITLPRCTDSE
jgi:hypothetical protein